MDMSIRQEVLRLAQQAPRAPETQLPGGADPALLTAFEERNGFSVPAELREWLLLYNAPVIGPGGIFGVGVGQFCDMDAMYDALPFWRESGWVPVAGDGCGDYYVLDSRTAVGETHPIYFVDQACYECPAYIVASGLWQFLRFLLEGEVWRAAGRQHYWPWEGEAVLRRDPLLAQYRGPVPFPWLLC